MADYFYVAAFFAVPIGLLAWFITALVLFLNTPKENEQLRRTRKTLLIVSAVLLGTVVAAIVALVILFAISIKHM